MREDGAAKQSGGTGLVTAGVVIAVVVAAGAYFGLRDRGTSDPQSQGTGVVSEAPVGAAPAPVSAAVTETAQAASSGAAPDTADGPAQGAAVEAAEVAQVPPSVDEVRLENDGLSVIAGRAEPGARVTVLVDGVEVATAVADARGSFAAVGVIAPSDTVQVLTLRAEGQEVSVASVDEVILAPLAKPLQQAVAEKPDETAVEEETKTADLLERAAPEATADGSGDDPAVVTVPQGETDVQTGAVDAPEDAPEDAVVAAVEPTVVPEGQPGAETATTRADPAVAVTAAVAPQGSNTASAAENTQTDPVTQTPGPAVEPAQARALASADRETGGTSDPLPEGDGALTKDEVVAPQVAKAASDTPEPVDTVVLETPAPAAASSNVAVLKSTSEGVELLQPAQQPDANIVIDTIGYSEAGDVQLAGRAGTGTAEVRVYLDNRIVATMTVAQDGRWRGSVQNVAAGIYRLRADAVDPAGEVTSRIETPFKREAPAVLAAATEGQTGSVSAITVQTGDTLWAIARDRYGEGVLYVRVVAANREAIRDPDLIYPGQIFDLPGE